jgi:putative heme iron utilization protein
MATDPIRPTDDEAHALARRLVRTARDGALATLEYATGHPFSSLVSLATDIDGAPLILVSRLSGHTLNLEADPRCSLLCAQGGKGDPLAHPRVTLIQRGRRLPREAEDGRRARRRFLARHPKAALYADFGDFAFWRLEPERASLNGGFGKAYALAAADLLSASPANSALAAAEQSAVAHMNADHRDAVAIYARAFARAPDGDWTLTGIDSEGMDLVCGEDARRIFFPEPLASASDMRSVLVRMAAEGRRLLQPDSTAHN